MGLFDRIFRPNKNKEMKEALEKANTTFKLLNMYTPVFRDWKGAIYESELCREAIDARARHISKLKVEFKGNAQTKLKSRMKIRPNSFSTWSAWLYRCSTILDATNTLILAPEKNQDNETIGFFPLLPTSVSLVEYKDRVWIRYRFANGEIGACPYSDCAVLTKFQFQNDLFGSNNDALNGTLSLIKMNEQAIKEAMKDGSSYRFMARLSNLIKDDDLEKEREKFNTTNFTNEAKSTNGLLLFPKTFENVQQINSKPFTVDAEQLTIIQKNVFRYFGTSEEVIMNTATADQLDSYYNGGIEPFMISLADAMTCAVYSDREIAAGNKVEVSSNRLQYMSVQAKTQLVAQLRTCGGISLDEMRELFNLPPLPDGKGEICPVRGEYHNITDNKPTPETPSSDGASGSSELV